MSRFRDLFLPLVCLFALVGAMANASARIVKDPASQIVQTETTDRTTEGAETDLESPDACGECGDEILAASYALVRPTLFALGDFLPSESALFIHYPPALERPPRLARLRA